MSTKIIDWLDKPRRMTIDLQAEMAIESRIGMGLQRAASEMAGPTYFVTILYCGLARNDPSLSFREVADMTGKALEEGKITGLEFQNQMMEMIVESASFSGFRAQAPEGEEPVPLPASSTKD